MYAKRILLLTAIPPASGISSCRVFYARGYTGFTLNNYPQLPIPIWNLSICQCTSWGQKDSANSSSAVWAKVKEDEMDSRYVIRFGTPLAFSRGFVLVALGQIPRPTTQCKGEVRNLGRPQGMVASTYCLLTELLIQTLQPLQCILQLPSGFLK